MPSKPAVESRTRAPAPQLRFRMRVTQGEVIAVGPGKIALLEAVDKAGTALEQLDEIVLKARKECE